MCISCRYLYIPLVGPLEVVFGLLGARNTKTLRCPTYGVRLIICNAQKHETHMKSMQMKHDEKQHKTYMKIICKIYAAPRVGLEKHWKTHVQIAWNTTHAAHRLGIKNTNKHIKIVWTTGPGPQIGARAHKISPGPARDPSPHQFLGPDRNLGPGPVFHIMFICC